MLRIELVGEEHCDTYHGEKCVVCDDPMREVELPWSRDLLFPDAHVHAVFNGRVVGVVCDQCLMSGVEAMRKAMIATGERHRWRKDFCCAGLCEEMADGPIEAGTAGDATALRLMWGTGTARTSLGECNGHN